MIDFVAACIVAGAALIVAVVWAASPSRRNRDIARIRQSGSSVLLGPGVQRVAYGAFEAISSALVRGGVSANAVTLSSVPLAAVAAVALATGHDGTGALLAAMSFGCDALDGMIARSTGTASQAGEVLDAACDRICEALMLAGIAIAWRSSVPLLCVVLLAQLGAQQVTLASAKAAAFPSLRSSVPRGVMRRPERAVYFIGAAAATGLLRGMLPEAQAETLVRLPLVVVLLLIGLVGNVSAISRSLSIARGLRNHEVGRAGE